MNIISQTLGILTLSNFSVKWTNYQFTHSNKRSKTISLTKTTLPKLEVEWMWAYFIHVFYNSYSKFQLPKTQCLLLKGHLHYVTYFLFEINNEIYFLLISYISTIFDNFPCRSVVLILLLFNCYSKFQTTTKFHLCF